ncbi:MAG: hypothetical protein MRY63_04350 [Neomegalonema sp.]|nr:hypothetical protein [Neomegalonema sp.]
MAKRARKSTLPDSLPPLALSASQAAEYIGVGLTLWNELVADGIMPPAKQIRSRRLWDRRAVEQAFALLSESDIAARSDWDDVA